MNKIYKHVSTRLCSYSKSFKNVIKESAEMQHYWGAFIFFTGPIFMNFISKFMNNEFV